VSLINIGYYGS